MKLLKKPSKRRERLQALILILAACLIAMFVTGCQTTGHVSNFCLNAKPIILSKQDDLTIQTARQLLAHNEKGRKLCGW